MGVAQEGGGAASGAESRYANQELFIQWGYRSWKTHNGNEGGECWGSVTDLCK